MRVIKIYTVYVSSANHYLDSNYEYFYSLDDALLYLQDFAEDWRDYKDHNYDCPDAVDVGYISCNLLAIKDGVTLPEDPAEMIFDYSDDENGCSLCLELPPYTDFVIEHEMPYGGDFWTLFADGHIKQDVFDGKLPKTQQEFYDYWKSHGWDGTVEEVIP